MLSIARIFAQLIDFNCHFYLISVFLIGINFELILLLKVVDTVKHRSATRSTVVAAKHIKLYKILGSRTICHKLFGTFAIIYRNSLDTVSSILYTRERR